MTFGPKGPHLSDETAGIHPADAIGIRGIVVHAISEEAKNFYVALGFDPSPREPMMLMVTLSDVRAAARTKEELAARPSE